LAEEAAWKFLEDNKSCFDMTVINPDIIIGPMLHNVAGPEKINETNRFAVYNYMDGNLKKIEAWAFPTYHFVRFKRWWPGCSFLEPDANE
jgi:hypothetical protein